MQLLLFPEIRYLLNDGSIIYEKIHFFQCKILQDFSKKTLDNLSETVFRYISYIQCEVVDQHTFAYKGYLKAALWLYKQADIDVLNPQKKFWRKHVVLVSKRRVVG